MTDSNLQNTVPEGAFGIGSKKTDNFTKNEKLRNTGVKDVPKMILDSLKNQTGATVLPQQITEKAVEKATIDGEDVKTAAKIAIGAATGVPAFVNGIADTGKGIYDYTRGKPYKETNIFDISSIEEQYAGDTAYELPKVFVQFLIPFGGIGKGSQAIGITSNLVKAKKAKVAFNVLKNPIQAGVAETLAFKPTENNFYNLFDPLVAKFPNLSNPIYEYLRADEQTEDFNFADRKLRQFLGATLNPVDVALTGKELTTGIKTLKTSEKIISNLKSQLDAVKADKKLKDTIVNELDRRDGFTLQKTLPSNADDLDVTTIKKVNNIKDNKKYKRTSKKRKFNNKPGGDPNITPNQINPEQVANSQRNAEFTFSRARVIKEEGTYSAVKSRQDTVAGAIKLLADTPKLRQYAEAYAAMYNEVPTDELTYALAEKITYATQQIAETNQKLINSIQVIKDPKIIEQDVLEITDNLLELDDWLRLGIPLRTEPARALSSMQIPTTGLSPEQLANLSPAERFKMTRLNQTDIVMSSDDLQLRGEQLRELLLQNLEEGKATGDFSKLNKLTNVIKRTEGKVEKLENLYKTGLIHRILDKVDPAVRLFNEIRINAMLSGPGTQEINLISGVLETFQSSFELALGATNKAEFDAAMAHMTALISDFNFSSKAWKQSWNLEDNFVNPGSLKTDYSDRFAVSMEGDSTTAKWVNRAGKAIRIPSRLMTANDALIQSRNIISSAHFEAYMEASKRGLKGQSRTDFIKENVDAVIDTFSTGSTKGLTRTQSNILKYAKEFGRRSTYTEDIRTDGLMIGKTAKVLNSFANQVPIARTYMSFVRTPNNIFKRQARRTPLLNNLMGELANDLNSLDPIVRQQARGQLRFSKGAGLIFLGLAYNKLNEDADVHLTGGGPNLFTPDGRVEFKKKWDNKWRPYSIGYAKKDADGNYIYGEDGKKMFDYYSYQRLDPLSGWIGLMTDFSRITGYLTQGETDEFITKYLYAFSRNIFDRSYLSDLRDFAIFSSDPARGRSHFADILTGVVPNLVVQGNRLPGDIADMIGVPKEESEILDVRRDTEVRAGDELFGIKAKDNQIIKELREMLNKFSERVPGYSMNLPPSRQHITDDFKTFPEKVGPDLISWIGKSETKNYKILTVLGDLGKTLPEPSDVIVGSSKGSKIEPVPLNTNQYQEVQKIINNQKLIDGLTLKQALDKYMETDYFKNNYDIVKRVGRDNAEIAISRIMNGKPGDRGVLGLGLRGINSFYIEKGQDLWLKEQGDEFLDKRVEILNETKDNYRKQFDQTLSESDSTF